MLLECRHADRRTPRAPVVAAPKNHHLRKFMRHNAHARETHVQVTMNRLLSRQEPVTSDSAVILLTVSIGIFVVLRQNSR